MLSGFLVMLQNLDVKIFPFKALLQRRGMYEHLQELNVLDDDHLVSAHTRTYKYSMIIKRIQNHLV
ncbi:hypothetical protein H1R20_g848, partial [Candolleomyces eurysporus]